MTTATQTIGGTILDQMGRGFWHMVGGNLPVTLDNGIQFGFMKGNKGINKVVINLEANDTYTMHFWKINRNFTVVEEIETVSLVYADQLLDIFASITGLDISL